MRIIFILIISLALIIISCNKDNEPETENFLFTKKWERPTVLHYPDSLTGYSTNTCRRYYQFNENGEYLYEFPVCNSISAYSESGNWSWINQDKKLIIEFTGSNSSPDRFVKIISVDQEFLHTVEFNFKEDEFNGNHWEKKYPAQ